MPTPSLQAADTVSSTSRGQPTGPLCRAPEAKFPSVQPPVSIFTPDFSQQLSSAPPSVSGVAFGSQSTTSKPGVQVATGIPPISSGSGWNDPPAMQLLPSKPKTEPVQTVAAPITQPLMHVPGTETLPHPVTGPGGLPPPPTTGSYSAQYGNAPYVSAPLTISDISGQFPLQG